MSEPAACRNLPALLVPLDQIAPDPDQPRLSHSEERLLSLADSIRVTGVIQALLLSPHPGTAARTVTPYMLVTGERRWHAARRAGLAAVPAVLRTEPLSPSDRLMLQIAENDPDLSEDLALFDHACAVERAFQLAGGTQAEFARRHRRSPAWLSFMLSLGRATGAARDALEENRLQGMLAARTFLRLPAQWQRRLLAEARRDGCPITLRRAELAAHRLERHRNHLSMAAARAELSNAGPGGGGDGDAGDGGGGDGDAGDGGGGGNGSGNGGSGDSSGNGGSRDSSGNGGSRDSSGNGGGGDSSGNGGGGDGTERLPPAPRTPAEPTGWQPGAAAPPAGRGLLPPRIQRRLTADGPPVQVTFSALQLVTLLILLGLEPAADSAEQLDQLMACL